MDYFKVDVVDKVNGVTRLEVMELFEIPDRATLWDVLNDRYAYRGKFPETMLISVKRISEEDYYGHSEFE
ncbi:hypothetical protein RyT2_07790 [Pseudolactococcus yaeyamensis]